MEAKIRSCALTFAAAALSLFAAGLPSAAQVPASVLTGPPETGLDSLVALALERNPAVGAAQERIRAARARVGPAGTLPDPMLGVGIMNFPIREPGFGDFMTMTTVAVEQRLPYPGKLTLEERAVALELDAATARLDAEERDVAAEVEKAYYDLAFLDRSLEVLEGSRQLLTTLSESAAALYKVGTGSQQAVLTPRVEAVRLASEATALVEARAAALARLNALLDRPSDTPLAGPRIPDAVAQAAVPETPERIRFASPLLGAPAADSPLPPLADVQQRALETNPALRAHAAEIGAQAARLDLARKAHLPDFDVSVLYGHRTRNADMMSLMVSVPLPVHRAARQEQGVAEAGADLAALEAEHRAMVNELRAEVAGYHSTIESARTQLALLVTAIVPQGRAVLEAATAAFRVGGADLDGVIDGQATLYDYEVAYFRALTDFAKGIADLERAVGAEVLP
ncbi:MAG: TolC family protein [Gemmatimonadales bacterium]